MAEASAAAAVSQHRFFCHSCKGEVSPKLPVSAGGWGRGVCVCGWGGEADSSQRRGLSPRPRRGRARPGGEGLAPPPPPPRSPTGVGIPSRGPAWGGYPPLKPCR